MIKLSRIIKESFSDQPTEYLNGQDSNIVPNNSYTTTYSALSNDEKRVLIDCMKKYNSYREMLKPNLVYKTANSIANAIELAERYVECISEDWFQADMARRDIKELKKYSNKMLGEIEKMKTISKNIEQCYEDIGVKLDRYFEIT